MRQRNSCHRGCVIEQRSAPRRRRRTRPGLVCGSAVCLGLALTAPAVAQERADAYPNRNILLLVPFPPGGPPDVIGRIVGQKLGEELGHPIVIENRPGASTAIASQAVARAAPDGYTMLATDVSFVVAPQILVNPGFDPLADLAPVGLVARSPMTVVVNPSVPARTVAELVALARATPGEIKVGHSGIGTTPHLGAVSFLQATGTTMLLVPYRGAALALNDVVAGHMQMMSTAPSTSIALTRDGKLRMLAVTGSQRIAALPDVPTFRESGIDMAGLDNGVWFGLTVPAATPAAIVATLNAAVNKAVASDQVRDKLAKLDVTPGGGTPQAFGALIASQLAYWKTAMQAAGVKPE